VEVSKVQRSSDEQPKALRSLSIKQRAVLVFIEEHIAERGFAPTIREMCAALGYASTNEMFEKLRRIERKGFIAIEKTRSRAIRVLRSVLGRSGTVTPPSRCLCGAVSFAVATCPMCGARLGEA